MRLKLTVLQRVVLGVAAAGILLTVYTQTYDDGFEGYWWVVPVLIAITLVVIAINPSTESSGPSSSSGSSEPPLWHNPVRQAEVMTEAATSIAAILFKPKMRDLTGNPLTDADSVQLQTMSEESVRISAFTYGYIVSTMLCKKQDRRFFNGEHHKNLRIAFAKVCEVCWKKVYGTTANEGRGYDLAIAGVRQSVEKAKEIELAIDNRMIAGDRHPLLPLYEYLDGSLGRRPPADELEERFAPITKALLVRFNQ
jgi:hypothetical protein